MRMHIGIQRASRCAHLRRYRLSLSRERDRDGLLRRAASRPVPPRAWETHGEPLADGKKARKRKMHGLPPCHCKDSVPVALVMGNGFHQIEPFESAP